MRKPSRKAAVDDVMFADGEVRFEFKVVTGHDRASVILSFRQQADGADYRAVIVAGLGWGGLVRVATRSSVARIWRRGDA